MAESPEGVQSMDGGRSRKLFHWFLLPVLSFFNCFRRDANVKKLNENASFATTQISGSIPSDLQLSDLPLLALLTICAHLKPDDSSQESCKDLYNFRNTCRTFTHAVNSFFEKPANLPMIEDLAFEFDGTDNEINLHLRIPTVNYLMHPLNANQGVFEPSLGPAAFRRCVSVDAYFDVDNDEAIDLATESLCGPLLRPLEVSRFNATSDINKVFNLSRNVIFTKMCIRSKIFYKENVSHILAYLREHSNVEEVIIMCDKFDNLDAPEFLTQLYSATKSISLMVLDWNRRYSDYHDLSNAFWQQFLLQKLYEGAEVRYNDKPFTAQTNFTDPHERLWKFDLRKY